MSILLAHEYNLLEDFSESLGEGWGMLFQSGTPEEWVRRIPGPLVVVSLRTDYYAGQWIDRVNVHAVISLPLKDMEDDCLNDWLYLGTVSAIVGYLSNGVNVLVHCLAGISRSTYISAGVLTQIHQCSYWQALHQIADRRAGAMPNEGFRQHLRDLEPRLHAASPFNKLEIQDANDSNPDPARLREAGPDRSTPTSPRPSGSEEVPRPWYPSSRR